MVCGISRGIWLCPLGQKKSVMAKAKFGKQGLLLCASSGWPYMKWFPSWNPKYATVQVCMVARQYVPLSRTVRFNSQRIVDLCTMRSFERVQVTVDDLPLAPLRNGTQIGSNLWIQPTAWAQYNLLTSSYMAGQESRCYNCAGYCTTMHACALLPSHNAHYRSARRERSHVQFSRSRRWILSISTHIISTNLEPQFRVENGWASRR